MDGNSWDLWGDDNLGNEGVMDSDISSSVIYDLGLGSGDFEIYRIDGTGEKHWKGGALFSRTDGLNHYKIEYKLMASDYTAQLWNYRYTQSPNHEFYTAWEVGLLQGYNNSIEMQFKIQDSYDRYDMSNEDNLCFPGFSYKLYSKGQNGLWISNEDDILKYGGEEVFQGVSQATEVKDHWYRAELRIPKEHISSESMFILLSPIWIKSETEFVTMGTPPKNIASLSKLVYYSDDEMMRVGCEKFDDLQKTSIKPSNWPGELYRNFTTVEKITENEYRISVTSLLKKTYKPDGSFLGELYSLEKTISADTYTVNNLNNITGELSSPGYHLVIEELNDAPSETILTTDYYLTAIKFPEDNLLAEEIVWAAKTAFGEVLFENALPAYLKAYEGVGSLKKLGYVINVVVGVAEIAGNLKMYFETDNPLLQRQYAENMWATGINIGLDFIPFYFVFEMAWKAVIYIVDAIWGWPDGVNVGTLGNPGALILFAIAYLIPGTIPSEMAQNALMDAYNFMQGEVDELNRQRVPGERFYVFIPPQ